MNNTRTIYAFISLFLVLVIGVSLYWLPDNPSYIATGENEFSDLDSSGATPYSIHVAVDACNSYAFKQYQQYRDTEESNIFFSPYSISTCLSMVYEGARGETAEEMQQVFEWSENPDMRLPATAYLYNKLNDPENNCTVRSANSVWAQEDYPFIEEYINLLEAGYGGKAVNIDFGRSDEARKQINAWVESRTNYKIKDLFEEGMITPDTRMVLTNALYFKGDWEQKFDAGKTRELLFNISRSEQVSVDMMFLRDKWFNYTENDLVQVLEMDYSGGDYSMIILLPRETGLDSVENSIDHESFSALIDDLEPHEMILSVPRFTIETKYVMNTGLSEFGMSQAFTPSADFSGVTLEDDLWLDTVVHQTYISVAENGTEAAAATGASYVMSMPSGVRFRVDHPFMFAILEKETGLILFIGRVVDPS